MDPGDEDHVTVEILTPDDAVVASLEAPVQPGDGAFSATPAPLGPGEYRVRATQRDDVGNERSAETDFEILAVPETCLAAPEVPLRGTAGPDELEGTPGRDLVLGKEGDDRDKAIGCERERPDRRG